MPSPAGPSRQEAVIQLVRLLGGEAAARRLGLPAGRPAPSPSPAQLDALRALAGQRAQGIARALLEEAAASDDVTGAASALVYLEDRLAFLGNLLPEEARARIREAFGAVVRGWG